ncbi:MAG: M81 family metallopeptidase, partial [Bosea sp. (in: a-proteobacteria)]
MSPRIAFGGFLHETNTFAPSKAGMEHFRQGGGWPSLSSGDAVFAAIDKVNVGASGFVEAARALGWTLVPTLWAAATPSAHVTAEAFETITDELVARIAAALPCDAVYLDLHGAMVSDAYDDGEGEVLARVRAVIGPDVPLVASLDLHGNVTARMVEMADALIAYRTYPHIDMAQTGARSAAYLADLLASGARHAKAFRQIPFLIPIAWQATAMEPCRTIYRELAALEGPSVPTLS